MKICGLMKLTLLDFPGIVACTVFLGGCNLRCPFCHNAELAFNECGDEISQEEFFGFLTKRKALLDGVCVSGGEPLMNTEIEEFLKKIKDLGYKVKLDTNGCFPEKLKNVIDMGLCDYIAMDIKNSLPEYGKTIGILGFDIAKIKKSVELIRTSGIEYEFRTTAVKGLHSEDSIKELSRFLKGEKKFFLQAFQQSDQVPDKKLQEFSKDELENLLKVVREEIPEAKLRGI